MAAKRANLHGVGIHQSTSFRIPEDIKTRARHRAAVQGQTLTDVVLALVTAYAKREIDLPVTQPQ